MSENTIYLNNILTVLAFLPKNIKLTIISIEVFSQRLLIIIKLIENKQVFFHFESRVEQSKYSWKQKQNFNLHQGLFCIFKMIFLLLSSQLRWNLVFKQILKNKKYKKTIKISLKTKKNLCQRAFYLFKMVFFSYYHVNWGAIWY
jgi:hypothetical protein